MSLSISVGGLDCSGWFSWPDIEIEDGFGARGKTARVPISIDTEAFAPPAKPLSGQIIRILVNGEKHFEGPISSVTDKWLNPKVYTASLPCIDYTVWLDKYPIAVKERQPETLKARIEFILSVCPVFTLSMDEDGPDVPKQDYDYVAPSSVIDELCETYGYTWYVDFDKVVWVQDELNDPAPIAAINLDTENRVSDAEVTDDWSDLHNRLYLKNFTSRSLSVLEDKHTSDGYTSFYKAAMEPWSVEDTNILTSPDNGVHWYKRSLQLDPIGVSENVTQEGAVGSAWVCLVNTGFRFPSNDIPAEGNLIKFQYYYAVPDQVLQTDDLTSQAMMAAREGGDGIHCKVFSCPNVRATTLADAQTYAAMLLARGAWPVIYGSFNSFYPGWKSGQTFLLSSPTRSISDPQNPGDPVRVWVKKVSKRIVAIEDDPTSHKVKYAVEFSSKPFFSPKVTLDEFLHRIVDKAGKVKTTIGQKGPTTSTSTTSTSTTTVTTTSTTMLERAILATRWTVPS